MKKIIAKKRFGQHFLTDHHILDKITHALSPENTDQVIEIGPGTGALTDKLLEIIDHLTVIELDRDLADLLKQRYPSRKITVIQKDILDIEFSSFIKQNKKFRVIGNLPYNISTPLLFHLINSVNLIEDMVFMVQKEVALRLCAKAGDKNYGRLSVMAQLDLKCQTLFDVPPESFEPPPKVYSSVIKLIPDRVKLAISDPERFNRIVKASFSQRRKTLRNALKDLVFTEQFEKADIKPSLRPENLDVIDFIRLANA